MANTVSLQVTVFQTNRN